MKLSVQADVLWSISRHWN